MMLDLERLGFSLSVKGSLLPFPQLEFLGMLAHLAWPTPSWLLLARKAERVVELAEKLVEQQVPTNKWEPEVGEITSQRKQERRRGGRIADLGERRLRTLHW